MIDLCHSKEDRTNLHHNFYKFSFLMLIVEDAVNEKQYGDTMSLSKITDNHI